MHFFRSLLFLPGDEENARIYAVRLTTADQSGICRVHPVSAWQNW